MFNLTPDIIPSPLNFTGSKYLLIDKLRSYFPRDRRILYDIFGGGGSVFVNTLDLFDRVYINDIIPWLIDFYIAIQNTEFDFLVSIIKSRNIPKDSQEEYLKLRERFNEMGDFIDFFILVSSCTNNMMRFNKSFKFNQTWGRRNFNPSTESKLIAYHNRIYGNNKLIFSNKSFDKVDVVDNSFVYLDPPYLITGAGYNCCWSEEMEQNLYKFMDALNGRGIKFLMSNVEEHKGIKNPNMHLLSKYDVVRLTHDYDKVSRNGDSQTVEILVKNY